MGRSSTGGEDTIALVEENKPDVVITQLDTDLNTAKEVLSRIRFASPVSKIVVLTMSDNLRYLQAFSKFGIDAYIHKTSSSEELLSIIGTLGQDGSGGGGGNMVWSPCPGIC